MERWRGTWAAIGVLAVVALASFAFRVVAPSASPDSDPAEGDPRLAPEGLVARTGTVEGTQGIEVGVPRVSARELEPLSLQSIVARADRDAMDIAGWVVNFGDRRPVPNAELVFMHEGEAHSLTSDVEGRFRFRAPEPGEYELGFVSAEGFLPYAPELGHSPVAFHARPGWSIDDVVFQLIPAIDMAGTVVDAEEEPVAGAEVRLFGAASGERALVSMDDRWRTDGEGRFAFHAPDWAVLEASHRDHGVGRARVDGGVQVARAMTITLASDDMVADGSLAGIVVDVGGEPVADVRLEASPIGEGPDELVAPGAQAISGPDGRFVLAPLLPGVSHRVVARHPGHPVAELDAPADTDELRVEFPAGVRLAGVVVDPAGEPVPAATVTLLRSGDLFHAPLASTTVHDARGRFVFEGVEPGELRIEALASGLARSRPVTVTVPPGGREDLRLELAAGATVVGQVVDANSDKPLEGVRVSVRGRPPLASSLVVPQSIGLTDAEGRFELRGVSPGRRSLNVAAFEHHPVALSGLELVGGETHGPIEVKLRAVADGETPTAEISGIGAMLGVKDGMLWISGVLPGGGAERAGLEKGDTIHEIDGEPVLDVGFEAAIEAIRGPEGTSVLLAVERASDGERVEVPVLRARVVVPPTP